LTLEWRAAGIYTLFPLLVAAEIGLLVCSRESAPEFPVAAIWLLHNSIFAALLTAIAIVTLGPSRAAAGSGLLTPRCSAGSGRPVPAYWARHGSRAADRRRRSRRHDAAVRSGLPGLVDHRHGRFGTAASRLTGHRPPAGIDRRRQQRPVDPVAPPHPSRAKKQAKMVLERPSATRSTGPSRPDGDLGDCGCG
jgi:hypothetical protein